MSEEHDDLFKHIGNDLERWLISVRDWQKIARKSYTVDQLEELQIEFKKEYHSTYKTGDNWFESPAQFIDWLREREKK